MCFISMYFVKGLTCGDNMVKCGVAWDVFCLGMVRYGAIGYGAMEGALVSGMVWYGVLWIGMVWC